MMTMFTTTVISQKNNNGDEVKQYTELIDTYGASTVIIAVFMVILLFVLGYILRNNQKTNNQLIKQQQELVNRLLEQKEEKKEPVKKEPDIVKKFLNINSNIKEILKDMNEELGTNRIGLYVFHNGVYSSHGLPFFKMTCIGEVVKKNSGVSKVINTQCGLPLQMFDTSISLLYKNGKISVTDVDDDDDEFVRDAPILIGLLKANNIKSATGIAIYDNDDNILGIVLAEFIDIHDEVFMEDIEKKLLKKTPVLSPILEYSGVFNNNNSN